MVSHVQIHWIFTSMINQSWWVSLKFYITNHEQMFTTWQLAVAETALLLCYSYQGGSWSLRCWRSRLNVRHLWVLGVYLYWSGGSDTMMTRCKLGHRLKNVEGKTVLTTCELEELFSITEVDLLQNILVFLPHDVMRWSKMWRDVTRCDEMWWDVMRVWVCTLSRVDEFIENFYWKSIDSKSGDVLAQPWQQSYRDRARGASIHGSRPVKGPS